jgi:hypothetical protein
MSFFDLWKGFVIFVIVYATRANLAYAQTSIDADLSASAGGLSTREYAFLVSAFFLGYFLGELPSSTLNKKFAPRKGIAR